MGAGIMTLLILAQSPDPGAMTLTLSGALVMGLSILLVLVLCGFCLGRILSERHPESHHHAPLDIETGDRQ